MSERLILAGLWSIPGIGPKTIQTALKLGLPDRPAGEWVDELGLPRRVRAAIPSDLRFADAGEQMLKRCAALGISVAFQGDPAYPEALCEIDDAPPLLFHVGPGAAVAPRRRIAMVGTRHPDNVFWRQARDLVKDVVRAGIGVVSGAAMGIDSWCHLICAYYGGETWAFVGSGLDQLDPAPTRLWRRIAASGATFFSEYPLGVRAEPSTFPRRNRLISGAAGAVLVLRAGSKSGTQHTVEYAEKQGRPVLAIAGDRFDRTAHYCNHLIHAQRARICLGYIDVMRAVGLKRVHIPKPHTAGPPDLSALSAQAVALLPRVPKDPIELDALMLDPSLTSGDVVSALFELELSGLIVRHGGGRVQRL